MFQTKITELFGIRYPIIMGGMAYNMANAELVAEVGNAGGLGMLVSRSMPSVKELKEEIRKTRGLTDKPFGVNIAILPAVRGPSIEECVEAVVEEEVKIVETAGRNPTPYVGRLKEGGVKIIHKCPSVRFAKSAEKAGVDAIAMLGFESAGHTGMDDISSLILTPLAARELNVPVVTAGGIGDARGFVAALALGAEGVLMGTRFLLTREGPAHSGIKERFLQAQETDTALILRTLGDPVRAIKNKVVQQVQEIEAGGTATLEELFPYISGERSGKALFEGDFDGGVLSIGQVTGLIQDLPTVREVIEGIIEGSKEIVERLHSLGLPASGRA